MKWYQGMFALGCGLLSGGFALAIHPNPQTFEEYLPTFMALFGGALIGVTIPIIAEAIKLER
jgi:hypothetical protein